MSTVHVGICHNDDFVITELRDIKIFSYACTESGNHGAYGVGVQHSVESCFFYIENFTAERKNRLIFPVAARLGGSACRVPFDDVNFCKLRIFFRAVRQFSRKARYFQCIFAACQFSRFSCSFSGTVRHNGFRNDFLGFRRMFFQISSESFGHDTVDYALDVQISQFCFCLSFKLGIRYFHGNDASQSFSHVIAG